MNRPLTTTALFTGNCGSKALPSRPTICGSRPSSCNIRLFCVPAMYILTHCPSSRACSELIELAIGDEQMHMQYFGDSSDIVKQSLIHWLGRFGDWSVHPMLTESATAQQVERFERFLGARVLS